MTSIAPPKHLQRRGRALWRGVLSNFDVVAVHDRERLQVACEAADRLEEARLRIEEDGTFIATPHGMRAHPAVKVEQDCRVILLRSLRELGVDAADAPAARLPSRWRPTT